jgi:hypothetical protein
MTNIILKVRDGIGDLLITTGRDCFVFEAITSSKIFTLTEANVSASTILVYKNGALWAGTNYSYSASTGKLTVTGTLLAGDSLEVTYSYYPKYSDTELQGFIRSAISYLVVEKYKCFIVKPPALIFPTPTEDEENLIAIVASILIKGDVISYRTPELTINFERGDSKEKKIHKFVRHFKKAFGYLTYIDPSETIVNENEDIDGD